MKRTRSQSTEAASSKKKTRREPMAEVPSKRISPLIVNPEPIHEGSEVPLHPRSRRTKALAVVTAEALHEEVIERQATGGNFVLASVPTKTALSSSFQSQE